MLAPDGELLSYIDHRKAMWYVKRGLASLEGKDPLVVKLLFEPNGRDATKDLAKEILEEGG
jgi:hypothetical protein